MTLRGRPHLRGQDAAGFTLLETLVALAILSVSALLIFQFVGQQYAVTSRVERISSDTISRAMERERFASVVRGLTPGWPDQADEVFTGTPARFAGLTSGQLESVAPGLSKVSLQIVRAATGPASQLVYRSPEADFVIAQFAQPASFSYLAPNGAWVEEWPEKSMSDAGVYDDSGNYRIPRPLPAAVRIRVDGQPDWVAATEWKALQLPRRQDQMIGGN